MSRRIGTVSLRDGGKTAGVYGTGMIGGVNGRGRLVRIGERRKVYNG